MEMMRGHSQGQTATVLIADDESEIRSMVNRFLAKRGYQTIQACNGREALGMAKVQLPQVVLLDLNMPELDGLSVCKQLRENPSTRLLPILMLTSRVGVEDRICGLHCGADDYLAKPFDLEELEARLEALLKRSIHMISANPLTQLPGNPVIQQEIADRIASGERFGAAYIDIDFFKAYNDAYGYDQGDKVIVWTAQLIQKAMVEHGGSPFLGHIGGDDFIVVSDAASIRELCRSIGDAFDYERARWYNWKDRLQNGIRGTDRQGKAAKFPLMSLSIGISTNEKRTLKHYAQVANITAEMKKLVKNRSDKSKSWVAADRRVD